MSDINPSRMIPLHVADQAVAACEKEIQELRAEVERLKEGNECLGQMHDKEMERSAYLCEEFNRTTAWGRGLESDLSHARVEISFLKAEVERLRKAGDEMYMTLADNNDHFERVWRDKRIDAREAFQGWNAAKDGKQP